MGEEQASPRDVAVKFSKDAVLHNNQGFETLASMEIQQALVAALVYVGDSLRDSQEKRDGSALEPPRGDGMSDECREDCWRCRIHRGRCPNCRVCHPVEHQEGDE